MTNTYLIKTCEKIKSKIEADYGHDVVYLGPLEGPLYEQYVEASINWQFIGIWHYNHLDSEECAKELGVEYPSISLIRHFDNELF